MTTFIAPTLLQPDNHAAMLIDHQYLQFTTLKSSDPATVLSSAQLFAEGARLFGVPTLLTTGLGKRQPFIAELRSVFPEQEPIDRTTLNAFEDERVVDWVASTGRKKLVMAGLWTESCLAMAGLSAIEAGYEVFILTDASGGGSEESHRMAIRRLIQRGAVPLTAGTYVKELQRDWARLETAGPVRELYRKYGDSYGQALVWEFGLLAAAGVPAA